METVYRYTETQLHQREFQVFILISLQTSAERIIQVQNNNITNSVRQDSILLLFQNLTLDTHSLPCRV